MSNEDRVNIEGAGDFSDIDDELERLFDQDRYEELQVMMIGGCLFAAIIVATVSLFILA